ncbi:MAG: hypothetical protein EHM48_03930, partial [Planctomycetaceae bacterium]
MAGVKWTQGVSKTSIGRFGSFRDDCVPAENGYLTCNAKVADVYLQETGEQIVNLGQYALPQDFSVKTRTNWVGKRYDFSTPAGAHSTVHRSLLFPGFHHRVKNGVFEYNYRIRNFAPTCLVLPLKSGMKHVRATDGYDRSRDGDLARHWVLVFFADSAMPFDYPMLYVFDKQPEKIEVWTHELWKIHFKSKAATVVQIHPFGAEKLSKELTSTWKAKLPADVEKKLDFWASAAMAYPTECKEYFSIDRKRGVVTIRNVYTYEKFASQWKVAPTVLAPLPPVIANARHFDYPVKVKGKLLEKLCPTFQGYYEAVKGTEIEYELPLSRFRNHTLAPVAIKNNQTACLITNRLAGVLESGQYLTFSGDDHYDPNCSMDSLHDLRIMAWAMWSIAPEKRAKVLGHLTRGLGQFDEKQYLQFTAPFIGTKWVRDKMIFDYLSVIDYDMEWYNGMNMAGLWNYAYYTDDPQADKLIKDRWPLIRKLNAYTDAYMDWSLSSSWTVARGEATWLDGINYTYEGTLAFAAMARRLGKQDDADWGDYLSAKIEAFVYNCWKSAPYCEQYAPLPDAQTECASGYYECRFPNYGEASAWSCGNYAYLVREVLVMLNDMNKRDDIDAAMVRFGRNFPQWRRDPYQYGKASGYPGSDPRRTIHHYFLDPRLMVCA